VAAARPVGARATAGAQASTAVPIRVTRGSQPPCAAVNALNAGKVADEALISVREARVFVYAE
jgi:hypothetical protein